MIDNAVCLNLTMGRLRERRRAKHTDGIVEVDADRDTYSVTKRLLESETLQEIARRHSDLTAYVRARSVPSMLKPGIYLVPLPTLAEIETKIQAVKNETRELAALFRGEYEAAIEAARGKLRALFDAADYPPADAVERYFYVESQVFSADVPSSLRSVSEAAYKRAIDDARAFAEEQKAAITVLLREELAELIDHLHDKLSPSNGERKVLRESAVQKLHEWLSLFDARNLAQDDQLSGVVERLRQLMQGVSVEDLRDRDDGLFRSNIRSRMTEIRDTVGQLVTAAPRRVIRIRHQEQEVGA